MGIDIKVPTLGESVSSATVARWLKKAGEAVAADEPLVELETDKVTVEVPAPQAGVLGAIAAEEGAEVEVGALLATLEAGASKTASAPAPAAAAIRLRASTRRPRRVGRCPVLRRPRPRWRAPNTIRCRPRPR